MLKKLSFAAVVVFAALVVSGCFSTPPGKIVYDPDLPKEQTAYVVIDSTIEVVEYNGINVNKAWYPRNNLRLNKITLPAGDTTLGINIKGAAARGNTIYNIRINDLQLKYNFEAGKDYTIALFNTKNIGTFLRPKQEVYLAIWGKAFNDGSPGISRDDLILKSWKIAEF
jgi:hypothetical protein